MTPETTLAGEIVNLVVIPVILALVGVFTRAVVRYINANTTERQREILYGIAAEAVQFAEQYGKNEDGQTRLALAVKAATDEAKRRKIPVDIGAVLVAIEAAVKVELNPDRTATGTVAEATDEAQPA